MQSDIKNTSTTQETRAVEDIAADMVQYHQVSTLGLPAVALSLAAGQPIESGAD